MMGNASTSNEHAETSSWLVVLYNHIEKWKGLSRILWKIKMFQTTNQSSVQLGSLFSPLLPGGMDGMEDEKCMILSEIA
jgi:hypothetical protein